LASSSERKTRGTGRSHHLFVQMVQKVQNNLQAVREGEKNHHELPPAAALQGDCRKKPRSRGSESGIQTLFEGVKQRGGADFGNSGKSCPLYSGKQAGGEQIDRNADALKSQNPKKQAETSLNKERRQTQRLEASLVERVPERKNQRCRGGRTMATMGKTIKVIKRKKKKRI